MHERLVISYNFAQVDWHAMRRSLSCKCRPAFAPTAPGCSDRPGEALQEVTLPDGTKFKIFDMCAVKIWVDTHENHRESLKIELIDRGLVARDDLVA